MIKSRLKKISQSVNLGNMIDSNKAIDLIKSTYLSRFTTDNVRKDISPENPAAILGLISDDGTAAAELYCFEQPEGGYVGVVVAVQISIQDVANKVYTIGTDYQSQMINDKKDPLGITAIRDMMVRGVTLFGINCTFNNSIKNMDQLLQSLPQGEQETTV